MTDLPPTVPRFNKWCEWKSIVARCSTEEYFRAKAIADSLSSAAGSAVSLYCAFTDFIGIEFVVLSSASDPAPFRRYPHGIVLVPCARPDLSTSFCIYDGWMPLADAQPATINRALQMLDETVSFATYILGGSSRWIVKYTETVIGGPHMAQVTDDDHARLERAFARLRELPTALQDAAVRCVHWMQHAAGQVRPTDRLLSLWQAFESLLLATYEFAPDISLPLASHEPSLSKAQRKKQRQLDARRILDEEAADPERAASRAYFEAVIGIRRRCEVVLAALLGPDPRIQQLFDPKRSAWSPNVIRNAILHEGRSALEIESQCPVGERCELVRKVLVEVLARVLRRVFAAGALPSRIQTFQVTSTPATMLPWSSGEGVQIVGDFRITMALLLEKGLV